MRNLGRKFGALFVIAVVVSAITPALFLPLSALADASTTSSSTVASTTTATTETSTVIVSSNPNANVAATVQSYFADIPVMIAIAACESGPRQFANNGTPLLGGTGTMVGVFQIDETIHYARALSLGFDIDTLMGNLEYARYLYGAEGTEPWISSFGCWGSSLDATMTSTVVTSTSSATTTAITATTTLGTATSTVAPALMLTLSLGSIDPQVLILQQLLNKAGYTLATSGPGSPGNETTKFGALTYAALKKFQCAEGIACSGDEATTGYGLLNAATRTALLAVTSNTTVVASSTTTNNENNPAQIAELQSQIAALLATISQLEAEIAAR
jgi:peptidoglycan hydrolase-like protein with peptidoglycan-binding domain